MIYAAFVDVESARHAIAELIRDGAPPDKISLVCKSEAPAQTGEVQRDISDDIGFGAMAQTFPDLRTPGPGNSVGDPGSLGTGIPFGGIAATANASTHPGEMSDYLWDSLPPDLVDYYRQKFEDGHAILLVKDAKPSAEQIVRANGAEKVKIQGYLA